MYLRIEIKDKMILVSDENTTLTMKYDPSLSLSEIEETFIQSLETFNWANDLAWNFSFEEEKPK